MYISSHWTARERLRVIATLADFIRQRTRMGHPYNEVGTPNAESIRNIAEAPAWELNQSRAPIEAFLRRCEVNPTDLSPFDASRPVQRSGVVGGDA